MSLRTPLSRVLHLGSVREGSHEFLNQRLTGLANIPLTLFLIGLIVTLMGKDHQTIATAFANPLVSGLTVLTIVSVVWHMQIGMKVIVEDYVHGEGLKLLATIGNRFFCVLVAGVAIVSVLKLSFGG